MSYGVVVPVKIAAQDVISWNRSAVSTAIEENGNLAYLTAKSTTAGEGEVWTVVAPATANLALGLWMVLEPEVVVTDSKYKGLDPDPRNFRVAIGDVMSVYKPAVGDLILCSADVFTGARSSNTYAVATDGQVQLVWGGSAISGLSYHYVETSYISISDGTVGTQRVTAYLMECVAVA